MPRHRSSCGARGCLQFASLPLQGKARRGGSRGCLQFEKSPSPAGRSPQRGRVGVGVSDIAHELNFLFFNDFAALTPTLSRYASNACPTGRGGISAVLPAPVCNKNNGFSQTLNRFLYISVGCGLPHHPPFWPWAGRCAEAHPMPPRKLPCVPPVTPSRLHPL